MNNGKQSADLISRIPRYMLQGGAIWMVYMGWKLREQQTTALTALAIAGFMLVVWGTLFWIDVLDMKGWDHV